MRFPKIILMFFLLIVNFGQISWKADPIYKQQVIATLKQQILKEAAWAMTQQPITVTAESSERSTGGKNDFYSEGDYWWPNPDDVNAPYIQKDGLTNPNNFIAHRLAMIRFSQVIGALASAYKLTGDEKYVKQAITHIEAWFINKNTMMNPNLLYAQAIKGVATGRGIGIIDTIQLMEVVQGITVMQRAKSFPKATIAGTKTWFTSYLEWLTTHQYGKDEMNAKNNHGTCWVMQVACFAKFTGDKTLLEFCRDRYKKVLLPQQVAVDGSLPLELKRTKPFGYSIFCLDAFATICQLLSTPENNLWQYHVNGTGIYNAVSFLYPYLVDKTKWPYDQDIMYWENWPVAQPAILFAAIAYDNQSYFTTWKKASHDPKNEEVIRNLPIRHPLIWIE